MTMLTVSGLFIYPVKSAAGLSLQTAQLSDRGFQHDRRWMVVDEQGHFMTQRRFPKMALIQVSHVTAERLVLTAPGMPELTVQMAAGNQPELTVDVWGDRTQALACGADADTWLTQFLAIPCQLVYMPATSKRPTDHGKLDTKLGTDSIVSFADAYPYLLLSEASLSGLNQKLTAKQEKAVPMNRFRPNIVVSGDIEPHAEDTWKRIRIGDVVFTVAKPCARCSVPNVDQARGDYPRDRHGQRTQEPSRTLATYRAWDKGIWFGQNLIQENVQPQSSEALTVGDEVEILASSNL